MKRIALLPILAAAVGCAGSSGTEIVPPRHDVPGLSVGDSYPIARLRILEAGWLPRPTSVPGGEGLEREYLSAGYFLSQGYVEVERCAGTGADPCIFNFQKSEGGCLRVTTVGERDLAVVESIERKCTDAI